MACVCTRFEYSRKRPFLLPSRLFLGLAGVRFLREIFEPQLLNAASEVVALEGFREAACRHILRLNVVHRNSYALNSLL